MGPSGPVPVSARETGLLALKWILTGRQQRGGFASGRWCGGALCFSGRGHMCLLSCSLSAQWENSVEGACSLRRLPATEGGGQGLGVLTSRLTERRMTGNCSELCAEASCREGCRQRPLPLLHYHPCVPRFIVYLKEGLIVF